MLEANDKSLEEPRALDANDEPDEPDESDEPDEPDEQQTGTTQGAPGTIVMPLQSIVTVAVGNDILSPDLVGQGINILNEP